MEVQPLTIDTTSSINLDVLSTEALKQEYFQCLRSLSKKTTPLRQIVVSLLMRDVHWQDLIRWAKDIGQNDKYLRKVVSEILTDLGIRRRRPGAGRETPQLALALLAYARSQYGEEAIALLGAAHRAGRAENVRKLSLPMNLPLPFQKGEGWGEGAAVAPGFRNSERELFRGVLPPIAKNQAA